MSAVLAEWQAGGRQLNLLGHSIFVREALADRPRLLLIHGFPSASIDWQPLWSDLAKHFSLCALDLLGFGFSAKPAGAAYSIGLQADLCQALTEAIGWSGQPLHLLAHDYGDTVAQELLARHLEGQLKLASVVFLNGGLFPESHRPRLVQKLLANPLLGPLLVPVLGRNRFFASMRAISGDSPPSDEQLTDLWALLRLNNGRARLPKLLGYMAERRRYRERWVGALLEAKIPLRLICGAADPISGSHLAERYLELLPVADLLLLPGVGHYPQLEDPAAVLSGFLQFHRSLDAQGQS